MIAQFTTLLLTGVAFGLLSLSYAGGPLLDPIHRKIERLLDHILEKL